jgi:hypothetical protein
MRKRKAECMQPHTTKKNLLKSKLESVKKDSEAKDELQNTTVRNLAMNLCNL